MSLHPMIPWPLLVLLALVLGALLWVSAQWLWRRGSDPGARMSLWRRVALSLTVLLILAGPSVNASWATQVSNVEIYLVVDRTGSMGAEDWAGGGGPRLDGVRSDLAAVREAFPDARFSILALDSTAARELPLTSDVDAVDSWIGSLHQEITQRSSGSSLERALPLLAQTLANAVEEAPEDVRLVYILSDGEATDDGKAAQEVAAQGLSWQMLAELVDGGAVLGYGTPEGGSMREFDGSANPNANYIEDPATGEAAVSVPDTEELTNVAAALGLPYIQRTGADDAPTSDFTSVDVQAALTDGRERKRDRQYVVWPLGLVAVGLLAWEAVALIRADRALRRMVPALRGMR